MRLPGSIFHRSRLRRVVMPLALAPVLVLAQTPPDETTPPGPTKAAAALPSADQLMSDLMARLPTKPVVIAGDLITTDGSSGDKAKLGVSILLCYPGMARYTIMDAFGRELEQLTVTITGGRMALAYEAGSPLTNAPAPQLGASLRDTALSWTDLTLAFVWWPRGRTIGQEEVRGQPCYVVDRHPAPGSTEGYGSVRMWIDTRVSMLLQADGMDTLGEPRRRLSVKSFKKINDEWMVKDIEFADLKTGARTVLRVRDARPASEER